VKRIQPHLQAGDRVLDVGCGGGGLGAALLTSAECPEQVEIQGLERAVRGDEPIEVLAYDGRQMPLEDCSRDVVILADVLHHDASPEAVLREAVRVSRRLVIIKDHKPEGFLGQSRVSFIDWAANAPYGVPCLYRYPRLAEWRALLARVELTPIEEFSSMRLYPPGFQQLFGGRLHYFVVASVEHAADKTADAP
jgi:SAM-dependent methyltransferase